MAAPFLTGVRRKPGAGDDGVFPWSLPLLRSFEALDLDAPVTFLVGENGCGKSTLLEGLAVGMGAAALGHADAPRDETLAGGARLAAGLRLVRRRRPRLTLFLRAEDVFGFVRRVADGMTELRAVEGELRAALPEGSYGQKLATGVAAGQRRALAARYGESPDARSHGELFIELLKGRLAPRGLYLLDEPEAPLSPVRLLALLALLRDGVAAGSQFVIATHSPILMALPGARLLLLDGGRIEPIAYDAVEHVRLTRAFLNDPQSFLRRL